MDHSHLLRSAQQETKSPDDVRARLAALLMKHPELKSLLNEADGERKTEVELMQEGIEPQTPDKFEVDNDEPNS